MKKLLLLTTLTALLPTGLAWAADATPDKSQYTLFNPVPDDQMRAFATDRPTKSFSPYTVDAGHFQYETDLAIWTYDHHNEANTTLSNVALFNTTVKLGLTQNTDFELAFAPVNFTHAKDRATDTGTSTSGIGDVFTRVKFNLLGNDGGNYAVAVVPYVKLPTASSNLGNGHIEGGAYIPFVAVLPNDWLLTLLTEVDILQDADLGGTHTNYQNLINIGHPLMKDVMAYAELYSNLTTDDDGEDQYTADFAVTWLVKENLQLDAGVNIGLNEAAPDWQPYIGISQRF